MTDRKSGLEAFISFPQIHIILIQSQKTTKIIKMKIFNPEIIFDPQKPFYHLVISYLAQVHGLIELYSRGIKLKYGEKFKNIDISQLTHPSNDGPAFSSSNAKRLKGVFEGGITELFGQQEMGSKIDKGIKIDIETLAMDIIEIVKGVDPLESFDIMSAGSLLVIAWEKTKNDHTNHELWEFFRHCRNAAAHEGFFVFYRGEPKRSAKWRSLEIKRSLRGQPLFTIPLQKKEGFILPGDILYFLSDIESTFYS